MPDLLDGYEDFASRAIIPTRDFGLRPMTPLGGTQIVMLRELRTGLEADVHDFVILKGARQIYGSTTCDGIALFLPQTYPGTVGQIVSDTDENRDYRRDIVLGMYASLPKDYKRMARLNNRFSLAWSPPNDSRLLFSAAGKREGGNLGRSRGLSFGYNDEVGSWPDQKAYTSLKASYSKRNPRRLYLTISTARGDNVFKEAWETAQQTPSQRAIFITWWMNPENTITPEQRELWEKYATDPWTTDEKHWIREVLARYGVQLHRGSIAWWRWQLDAECFGDEAMAAQEFGILPEEAFVAFGEKFIPSGSIRRMRAAAPTTLRPRGYRYDWPDYIQDLEQSFHECDPEVADVRVWEEADPEGVYIVSAHPARSSHPNATLNVAYVWRAFRETLVQVAEFVSDDVEMYRFAWALSHLGGAYRTKRGPSFLLVEVQMSGVYVWRQLEAMRDYGRGFRIPADGASLSALVRPWTAIQHYMFKRPDIIGGAATAVHMKSNLTELTWLMLGLRNEIERRALVIRSQPLIEELSRLRRGEKGDFDEVSVGSGESWGRAHAAALGVECWTKEAMGSVYKIVPPQAQQGPTHVGEAQLAAFLRQPGVFSPPKRQRPGTWRRMR